MNNISDLQRLSGNIHKSCNSGNVYRETFIGKHSDIPHVYRETFTKAVTVEPANIPHVNVVYGVGIR